MTTKHIFMSMEERGIAASSHGAVCTVSFCDHRHCWVYPVVLRTK